MHRPLKIGVRRPIVRHRADPSTDPKRVVPIDAAATAQRTMSQPPTDPAVQASGDAVAASLRRRLWQGLQRRLVESGLEQLDLRWRFRLVVFAFGVPFLAYIVWSAAQQALLEKDHVRDRARANAVLASARFEDHIEQVDRLLATVAQSVGTHSSDVAGTNALLQNMRPFLPKAVDNVGVWSLAGESIAALDRRAQSRAVNVADRRYFRDAIAHRDLAFEGPVESRITNLNIIVFARPIFDADNRVIGVITMSFRSADLVDQLDPVGMISRDALVTIINDHGIIVSRSIDPQLWVGKQVGDVEGLMAAFATRSGTREETGIDGQRRLAGYATVAGWPWVVMVGEPIERVLEPVSMRLLKNLGLGLAILGIALLIAGRVAAWTTGPVVRLAHDAARLGEGDLAHRSDVVSGGEIATLASNFNRMAEALQQRELALARSREQLRAIADNVPEQITYVDRDERYRFINAFPGPFKNVAIEDMLGKTILEARGEAAYREVLPAFQRAMSGESFSHERTSILDGQATHYFVTYVPDFETDGSVKGVYAFAQDITQRKIAELQRIESEKRLVTITDNLPAMICYVDATGSLGFANRAFEQWFERPLDEIIGQSFDRLMAPELAAQFHYVFLRGMQGETLDYEVQVPSRNVGPRWLKISMIPDIDATTGKPRGVYGMIHNVTKTKEAEQRLTRLAQYDTLTGLANRHQFNETFERVLAANDHDGRLLALMFLDIDHFKQVNDRHGHGSGDLLLKEFAHRLADCVRPTDAVARLSGDEFVVLLEGMHSDEEPQFIARKIIAAVEKPFMLDEEFLRVTASIGIAMRRTGGEPASVLMKRADEALYEAKRAGRNTFRLAVN